MSVVDTAPPDAAAAADDRVPASAAQSPAPDWNPWTRLGFRIGFLYFSGFMYLFGSDSIFYTGYRSWPWLSDWLNWPLGLLAVFAGNHIFHLPWVPSHWQVSTRGDLTINWLLNAVFLATAVIAGLVWTGIAALRGSRRTEYRTLLAWLRFFLRLAVGFFMVGYGMIKVFPLQMGPIPTAVLNQPFGQMWQSTLIWSMMGLHPLYESMCGVAEVMAGALLLFRRTALLGALLSVGLMCTVVSYNFFFDISIRLFALNLLLAAIFLVVPDAQRLLDFFWRHKAAIASDSWVPPSKHPGVRAYVRALEVVFIVGSLIVIPYCDAAIWHHSYVLRHIPSPLIGAWHLDAGHPPTGPFVNANGSVTDLYIDNVARANARYTDGSVSGGYTSFLTVDPARHSVFVAYIFGGGVAYRWQMPDANHLILTPLLPNRPAPGRKAAPGAKSVSPTTPAIVTLTRIQLPDHYRLFQRDFELIAPVR